MYSLFILVYRDILFVVCNFIGLENTQKEYRNAQGHLDDLTSLCNICCNALHTSVLS